jgi:hypothetical protein
MKEVRDATARILDHTTLAGLNAQVAHVDSSHKRRKRPSAAHKQPQK